MSFLSKIPYFNNLFAKNPYTNIPSPAPKSHAQDIQDIVANGIKHIKHMKETENEPSYIDESIAPIIYQTDVLKHMRWLAQKYDHRWNDGQPDHAKNKSKHITIFIEKINSAISSALINNELKKEHIDSVDSAIEDLQRCESNHYKGMVIFAARRQNNSSLKPILDEINQHFLRLKNTNAKLAIPDNPKVPSKR